MTVAFLAGVRVIEVGESRAAGFAGKLLRDLGAEVWLVEPPGCGNRLRRRRPLLPCGTSGLFEFLARGKRSVCIDLDQEDGRELVRRFAATASGVIAERAIWRRVECEAADAAGVGPYSIVTVSSRGERGAPHAEAPESEFVDAHEGGIGYMTPGRVDDPVREYPIDLARGGQAAYIGGLYAAIAFLHGLTLARATGETVHNDVSLQAAAASMFLLNLPGGSTPASCPAGCAPPAAPAAPSPASCACGTAASRSR